MEELLELCRILVRCQRPQQGSVQFRYLLTFLLFWAMCLEYSQRVCLSVTIVAMINHTNIDKDDTNITQPTCQPLNTTYAATDPEDEGDYRWKPSTQGIILGAYFYGFMCTQAVGRWLSEEAGEKPVVGMSILISSFLTFVTPVAADMGVCALALLRFTMGLVHGVCMPTAFSLFARWAAMDERSTFSVLGDHVGTVLAMPLAGYLCEYGFAGGWPSVYYTLGGLGCIWSALWLCLVHNRPSEQMKISSSGVFYIQRGHIQSIEEQKPPVPWKSLLKSMPVWAVSISTFCGTWGYTTLLTKLPTYFEVVLHVPIQKNGLVNSLIYVSTCGSVFFSGYFSDYLKTQRNFNPTTVRKGFEFVAMFGPALCTALIPAVTCDRSAVIVLLSSSMAFLGFTGGGHSSIGADMSPQHVASIYGLSNTIGCTAGILSPLVAGILLDNAHANVDQWSIVFYISSGFYFIGGSVFLLFASGERQSWAEQPKPFEKITPTYPFFYSEEKHTKLITEKEKRYGTIY